MQKATFRNLLLEISKSFVTIPIEKDHRIRQELSLAGPYKDNAYYATIQKNIGENLFDGIDSQKAELDVPNKEILQT